MLYDMVYTLCVLFTKIVEYLKLQWNQENALENKNLCSFLSLAALFM